MRGELANDLSCSNVPICDVFRASTADRELAIGQVDHRQLVLLDAREPGGLELARIRLRPGAGGVAGEPLARREAPIAPGLARRMRAAEAVLRVAAPSGTLLLRLEAPLPSEFGGGARALRAEDLEPLAAARGGFRAPVATRGHAAAPWLPGVGLALLFASALIRPIGQGIRPRDR